MTTEILQQQTTAIKPYVVSADLGLLLAQWSKKTDIFTPSREFMLSLRERFSKHMHNMFPNFILLDEIVLKNELEKKIKDYDLPVVTLDRVYTKGDFHLEISRVVNVQCGDLGIQKRAGTLTLPEQINYIVKKLSGRDILLSDDVIFEGNSMSFAIHEFRERGITVRAVCVGVGINEGLDRIATQVDSIESVYTFDSVVDEVCERDFYPGTPFSGRTLVGNENIGLPYIAPFGLPEKWASIAPGEVKSFSRFCIQQTIELFLEIEKNSGKRLRCRDLPRKVHGLPVGDERFVDVLHDLL